MRVKKHILALTGAVVLSSSLLSVGVVEAKSSNVAMLAATSSSHKYTPVKVIIDGSPLVSDQSAIMMDGSVMTPMRAIFERLGATISWNQQTQTITAFKGSTKVVLTIGKSTAMVNGKTVQLSKAAVVLNGSTLVPLRFVSESLGATVSWNSSTSTATISSGSGSPTVTPTPVTPAKPTTPAPTTPAKPTAPVQTPNNGGSTVNGIKTLYGNHNYGVKSQAEYNKVIEIANKALDGYKNKKYYDNDPQKQAYEDYYFNGVKWDGKLDNPYSGALYDAMSRAKELSSNGISTEKAIEILTIRDILVDLVGESANIPLNKENTLSAYDLLVKGSRDCQTFSQVMSAIFDIAGYNTAIQATNTHATPMIKLSDGNWYDLGVGVAKMEKVATATSLSSSNNGLYLMVSSTY